MENLKRKQDGQDTGTYLSAQQVANMCNVSSRTVLSWRYTRGLKAISISKRCVRYDIRDVQAMLEACK